MSMVKLLFSFGLLLSCRILSQTTGNRIVTATLPVVTLMDVEPAGSISLNYTAPTEAGNPITVPAANTSKWLNYTSAITSAGVTRRITASINQVVPGTDIRIQAAAATGSGGGTLGTPLPQIVLTATAQTIVSGIGGAFTGNGTGNGHRLTISLAANTYANISAMTNTSVVITYTITE